MTPAICCDDIVIVRKQPDAENGEIVIAAVTDADAVCKSLRKYSGCIEQISNKPSYEPKEFTNKEFSEKPAAIIGKAAELRRKF